MALPMESADERDLSKRSVRPVVRLLASREGGVRVDGDGDESAHAGPDHERVEGGVVRSSDALPEQQAQQQPTASVTEAEFADAVAEYVAAAMSLQDAMRDQRATTSATFVMEDRYRNMLNLGRRLSW